MASKEGRACWKWVDLGGVAKTHGPGKIRHLKPFHNQAEDTFQEGDLIR